MCGGDMEMVTRDYTITIQWVQEMLSLISVLFEACLKGQNTVLVSTG